MWKPLLIVGAAAISAYRVRALRRRHVSVAAALGFALDRRPLANFSVGVAIAAVAMSGIFVLEWSTGLLSIASVRSVSALTRDMSTYLAVPLVEEFVFRCAILGGLLLLFRGPLVPIVVSAALFGGLHAANANATLLSVLSTTLGGLAYGTAFAATERIWLPFGLHFGWNYFQARVFGFSISGGAVRGPAPLVEQSDVGSALLTGGAYGPEGGLIGIGARIFVLAMIAVWLSSERRRRASQRTRSVPSTGTPQSET